MLQREGAEVKIHVWYGRGPVRQGLVIAMLVLAGCREGPFAAAAKQDTVQGWREFIARNPDDDRVGEAQDRLTELEFDEARAAHTVVAYKRFLEAHPGAPQQPAALALLEGLRFQAAGAAGTSAAWRQFLRDHPDGARSADAAAQLKALEARRWLTEEDPAALEALVKAAPATEAGAQAAEKLEALAWARAATPTAFQAYLDAYPAGGHRDQAKARLLEVELQGLLVSGVPEEAKAVFERSPLKGLLPGFPKQLETARAAQAAAKARGAEQALAAWYLRPEDELERSLEAPDPLDRWQAAQELGEVVSVKHLDGLLGALKRSRSALVRFRAFEALQRVVAALPSPVAELELGRRRVALGSEPADAESALVLAVLLELSGDGARAAAGYRRCLTEGAVDPVALWRWSTLARGQGRSFSAAVAAAHLSRQALAAVGPEALPAEALGAARQLCSARHLARVGAAAFREAGTRGSPAEAADLAELAREVDAALRLVEAKLRDGELRLLEGDARARLCDDARVDERLGAAVASRRAALERLGGLPPAQASLVRTLARWREPDPGVRSWLETQR